MPERGAAVTLLDMLRERYAGNTHINLTEVRNAAGFDASRSCDMLSLGTWPSRGLFLRGFELKIARADWKRELADPAKAESFAVYCDEWYLVAGDSKIVQLDELPPTWGLLVAKGTRLECVQAATKNPNPKPITRGLLVAMLKRAVEQNPSAKVLEEARAAGVKSGKESVERTISSTGKNLERIEADYKALREKVRAFETASGIPLEWGGDGKKIGEAVKLVLYGGVEPMVNRLKRIADETRQLTATMDRIVAGANTPADPLI